MDDELEVIPPDTTDAETDVVPWLQMEKEPDIWYSRFLKYYVALGPARSLLKAMLACYQAEDPVKYDQMVKNGRQSASGPWGEMSRAWMWRERARAYDGIRYQEAQKVVEQARTTIIENTQKAAQALVDSLANPRLAVAAAKEILDRGGLPGTVVRENRVVPFTADELAAAHREVEEWERQLTPKSDESG